MALIELRERMCHTNVVADFCEVSSRLRSAKSAGDFLQLSHMFDGKNPNNSQQ